MVSSMVRHHIRSTAIHLVMMLLLLHVWRLHLLDMESGAARVSTPNVKLIQTLIDGADSWTIAVMRGKRLDFRMGLLRGVRRVGRMVGCLLLLLLDIRENRELRLRWSRSKIIILGHHSSSWYKFGRVY